MLNVNTSRIKTVVNMINKTSVKTITVVIHLLRHVDHTTTTVNRTITEASPNGDGIQW